MTGGVLRSAGAIVLGPRIGKFNKDGTPNAIPGHNIPMAIIGTFILVFGWFGFNAGSTLAGATCAWRCCGQHDARRPAARSRRCSTCGSNTANPTSQ